MEDALTLAQVPHCLREDVKRVHLLINGSIPNETSSLISPLDPWLAIRERRVKAATGSRQGVQCRRDRTSGIV